MVRIVAYSSSSLGAEYCVVKHCRDIVGSRCCCCFQGCFMKNWNKVSNNNVYFLFCFYFVFFVSMVRAFYLLPILSLGGGNVTG
jgi:hypothetical protein